MSEPQLEKGELLALLDGIQQPHVTQALRESPELQQELAEIRQLDAFLQRNWSRLGRPDPQDLVDVVSGQATSQQRLLVAAYVGHNARGRQELETLQKEFASLQPPSARPRRAPAFIATPVLGLGLRSTVEQEVRQSYQVVELQAQVTLHITPLISEAGQIAGYVTQHLQPIAHAKVTLHTAQIYPRRRTTDEMGFFTFRRLVAGIYTLRIHVAQGIMLVERIELKAA